MATDATGATDAHRAALDAMEAGDFVAAAARLRELFAEGDPSPMAVNDLALCEWMLGEVETALQRLDALLAVIDTDDPLTTVVRLNRRWVAAAADCASVTSDAAAKVQELRGDGNTAAGAPAVSVIMPTYNRASLIRESIESVLAQTFADFELLVVNDGGDRALEPTINELQARDGRVRYVYAAHGDSASALNVGLHVARAPLIAYLDDDDVWYPNHLRTHVEHLAAHPDVAATFSRTRQVDYHETRDGGFRRGRARIRYDANVAPRDFRLRMPIVNRAPIVHRTSLIEQVGPHREALITSEDWDFALRIARAGGFVGLDAITVEYRVRHALARKGGRSPRQHRRDWNTILFLNGEFPLTGRQFDGSTRGARLARDLAALVATDESVADLLELRKLLVAGPGGEARLFYELGKSLRRVGLRAAARAAFGRAVARHPWSPGWWWKWLVW